MKLKNNFDHFNLQEVEKIDFFLYRIKNYKFNYKKYFKKIFEQKRKIKKNFFVFLFFKIFFIEIFIKFIISFFLKKDFQFFFCLQKTVSKIS